MFYHVYKAGSISGAARDLNVSQPSVSKVLRHTEDQLGLTLFHRSKGKLVPTQIAHELFAEASELYDRVAAFNRSLENLGGRRGGHLRLGVLPALSLSVGPELIATMRKSDDQMSFELTTLHSEEIAHALLEKRSDFCIGFEPISDQRISSEAVGEGSIMLVSARSLDDQSGPVDPAFLTGSDLIGMRESGPLGRLITDELDRYDIKPNEVVTAHTYHVALSLVRKQVGIALADQFTAFSQLGSGLHRYPLAGFPKFQIFASHLSDHPDLDSLTMVKQGLKLVMAELQKGISALQMPTP